MIIIDIIVGVKCLRAASCVRKYNTAPIQKSLLRWDVEERVKALPIGKVTMQGDKTRLPKHSAELSKLRLAWDAEEL